MSATQAILLRLQRVANLTQVEISRRTGIPQPRLSRWSKGNPPGTADDALRLQKLHDELLAPDPATTQG